MRTGGRRGASGKSSVILDLIDHYWPQIEGDFARGGYGDARDWIRGLRPWDQFLNFCRDIAQTSGTRLRAAQLNDPRFEDEWELLLEEDKFATSTKPFRPSWEGFSPEIEAMYDLSDDIRLLVKVMSHSEIPFRARPESPVDRAKVKLRRDGFKRIQDLLT